MLVRTEPLPADTLTFDHMYMRINGRDGEAQGDGAASSSAASATSQGTEPHVDLIVGDPDVRYPLASVTKPIGAYAVLVAIDQGKFGLDDAAGPEGSTVRHLLAHTSGMPFFEGEPIAKPGKRRVYSNSGFDVLAEFAEAKVGMPIHEWIAQAVAGPLGMDDFSLAPGASMAAKGVASGEALARFAMELLEPKLISRELYDEAISVQFPGLAGVLPGYGRQADNDWGLGFSIRGHKDPHWLGSTFSPRTFGHFGQSGSFIWVDPEAKLAGIFLGAQRYGEEHQQVWPKLTDEMRAL